MMKQILQAVENMEKLSKQDQQKFKAIMQRYVSGEIDLAEAYYDLLDGDLISMPQRCSLYAKPEGSAQDEEFFRNYIDTKCAND